MPTYNVTLRPSVYGGNEVSTISTYYSDEEIAEIRVASEEQGAKNVRFQALLSMTEEEFTRLYP